MAPNGNENHEHYDTQDYAGDSASDASVILQQVPGENSPTYTQVQGMITDYQASELSTEVRMGDDRVIGDVPNWNGYSSQQLYDFATTNNSPTTADSLGRAFNDGGNRLADAANNLFEAVTAIQGAWTGVASDSARSALAPLAQAAGQAGQTAQMMGVQMSRQSIAATEVRKLPPPREFDQQQMLQAALAGGPVGMQADLRAQREAADAVKREQITYLEAYTQAMSAVDAQTPSFVPPPTGRINPSAGGGGSVTGGLVQIPGTGGEGSSSGGTSTGGPTGGYVGVSPVGGNAPGTGLTPGYEGEDIGDLAIPGTLPGTATSGYTPGGPPAAPPAPTFGPGGGGAPVPAAGAGGFGGAFGNFGGTGLGGNGGGAPGGAAGQGQGPAPRGMGGPGMAPAGRGMGPGGGGMGAGGRRADGEDDDEHDRPAYLLEGDPDSAFGNDQMSAPSVIGGDDDGA